MDKDRIVGSVLKVKGVIKETIGKVTHDPKLEAEGTSDKWNGTIQKAVGDVKDKLRDEFKK